MNTWNIPALLAFHRSAFGDARMEDPPAPPPADPLADPPKDETKFSQADVDRMIADRLKRAKPADYDELKGKAKRLDEIEAASASELEKAVKTARAEGESEATKRANGRLVAAEARALAAEAKFRNPALAVKSVDLSSVAVGDDGEVDSAAIKKALDDLAKSDPYLVLSDEPPKPPPTFGGGPRPTPPTPTDPRSADLAQIEADLVANRRK
jgi:hypothetical protein